MKSTIRILLLSAAVALPSMAVAQDVSEANAKAIEAKLTSLMAKKIADTGALSVKAAGDHYEMLLDLRKALEKNIAPWTLKEASSILHSLRPAAGGLWDYAGKGDIRLAAELAAANQSRSVALNVGSFENKGTFDARLGFVRNGDFKSTDLVFSTRSAKDNLKIAAKDYAFDFAFAEKKPGLGDVEANALLHGVSETFGAFPSPETRLSGETITGKFSFRDVDFEGIGQIVDFWGGSAKGKRLDTLDDAELASLSNIMVRHAPFASRLGENTRIDGVSVNWARNALKMENLAYHWTVEGIGGDAAIDLGAKAMNLTMEADGMPAVLKKALPKDASLRLRYSGFEMSTLWATLSDPKVLREKMKMPDFYARQVLPGGRMKANFDGTYVRSDYYDIALSGELELPLANPGRPEKADLTVSARDFDKTIKFLQDLSREDPRFNQVSFTAMVIKGFGKAQADGSTLWHIEIDASGRMTVNGQPVPMR